jgi:catechol 2,3-dioxygenase-like lactoylglutathione lyase family enzyme
VDADPDPIDPDPIDPDPIDPGPITGLSAVTVVTSHMPAAVAFYEALGFRLLYGGGQDAFSSFRAGSGYLNLQLDVGRISPGPVWGRAIFWVDDVDAVHGRALAAGLTPATAPADAEWGERFFHIRDPDGHEMSFARPSQARLPEAER